MSSTRPPGGDGSASRKASHAAGGSSSGEGMASLAAMTEVLIATDADAVFAEVEAALVDEATTMRRVRTGQAVAGAVAEATPDLVILDLQIGNMGGIAACLHLRHEAGAGRLPEVPVLVLLDRQADVFLARR